MAKIAELALPADQAKSLGITWSILGYHCHISQYRFPEIRIDKDEPVLCVAYTTQEELENERNR